MTPLHLALAAATVIENEARAVDDHETVTKMNVAMEVFINLPLRYHRLHRHSGQIEHVKKAFKLAWEAERTAQTREVVTPFDPSKRRIHDDGA